MGLLDRLFSWTGDGPALPLAAPDAGPQAYGSVDLKADGWPDLLRAGYSARTGRAVSERSAMSNATFQRAVTLITSAIAMLPLNLMERKATGDREKAESHPVQRLLRLRPNSAQTPFEFKSYMQGRALLHGDAYAYKVPGVKGPQALWPLDPKRVTAVIDENDFGLRFKYQPKTGAVRMFGPGDIFHLRSPWSSDGLTGEGLLKLAAEVLALADVTDEAAASLLRGAAEPGGIMTHPKTLSDDAIRHLREQWKDRFEGGSNKGRWIVTEEGMTANPFPVSGRDAESVAQRKFQAEEISRATGVPRPLLSFDDTSWGSGIEQLGLYLVTYCLAPWFVAWEEAVARDLLSEAEARTHYAKFNEGALLRGSLKDQAEFLAKALGGPGAAGFMVPNEARDKMDMNHIAGGDEPAWIQGSSNA